MHHCCKVWLNCDSCPLDWGEKKITWCNLSQSGNLMKLSQINSGTCYSVLDDCDFLYNELLGLAWGVGLIPIEFRVDFL